VAFTSIDHVLFVLANKFEKKSKREKKKSNERIVDRIFIEIVVFQISFNINIVNFFFIKEQLNLYKEIDNGLF
jgi:hypothetical protein